jgi:hypothetical protein
MLLVAPVPLKKAGARFDLGEGREKTTPCEDRVWGK